MAMYLVLLGLYLLMCFQFDNINNQFVLLGWPYVEVSYAVKVLHYAALFAKETTAVLTAVTAAAAFGGRSLILAWRAFKARPVIPRTRRFYNGGFEEVMTKREAALILGVRERTVIEKIKEAHKRAIMANHPDAGGSHYLALKITEARDILMGKNRGGSSAF
ncbi:mitochondrial import inner membrane translocase subunit TIM14-3-like [Rutidosis leptorrhynchoides]|uniref:mitochondrial import inner membrane translocase subunit TIM14-3-like n=1 Tax=Rutidosis leptorrhynchoides TaxID=125765 RepID=UPI003A9961DA